MHAHYNYVRAHATATFAFVTGGPPTICLMPDDATQDVAAWRSLLQAQSASLRAIEQAMSLAGQIPLTWYDVLLELNGAPQRRLRAQQLSDRVLLSRTRVSRLVDEIARAGLVTREPDPTDGRGSFVVLAEEGRRRLQLAAPVYLAGITEHFGRHLSDDELEALRSALDKVIAAHRAQPGITGR